MQSLSILIPRLCSRRYPSRTRWRMPNGNERSCREMSLLRRIHLRAAVFAPVARLQKPYVQRHGPNSEKSDRVTLSPVFLRNGSYNNYCVRKEVVVPGRLYRLQKCEYVSINPSNFVRRRKKCVNCLYC